MLNPKYIRDEAGLTQLEMSKAIGCSQAHISRIEKSGFEELSGLFRRSYELFVLERMVGAIVDGRQGPPCRQP
ncbi:helix-turn-helix transcriptional regulator [Pseudovibrio sp. Tun.PSC04-5.I4]|uniref:helix-turn-helix domain-containing protein n=1 Tax=Pseudovibrio sp. Tun.PSC04-5.I4 TaxID=1798213 RepID=UPI00088FD12E|nr:helix-turn-helix transcriptional regulator [Pseudovibrio sp. Tun.PSC04-5.I4]SDR02234.1 Helix-turn-helix [Pseudovibrio sp. Tun.PSC04-5.I4]